jgi:O-antigen/teichoic acid export membrane protein
MQVDKATREGIALGVIPHGMMNDFAHFWGFSDSDYEQTIKWLKQRRIRKIDLGCIRYTNKRDEKCHRYFLNCINVGLIAAIMNLRRKTHHFLGSRTLSFISSFVLMIFQRLDYKMHVKINEDEIQRRVMTMCIGNASGYGQTPNAVPYNGLLIARERFLVFCSTDVAMSLFKLFFTYLLIDHFEHKLIIYTYVMAFMTAFPTVVFFAYCRRQFAAITRFVFVREWRKYYDVLNFSIGIGIGAIATIGKAQGGALIINMFFSTTMNAGLAVANSVSSILQNFANNAQKPISPQIVKNYAAGNLDRCTSLVCLASKATYLSMFFVSIPFILAPEVIFDLWLKEVPPYAITFTHLLIVDILIFSINAGVNDFVFATGKIKLYQIIVNTLLVSSIVVGYLAMRRGMPPEYLFYVYIAFSFLVFLVRPFIIVRITKFDVWALVRGSYVPVLLITLLFVPTLCLKQVAGPIQSVVVAYAYFVLLLYFIGLRKNERQYVNSLIRNKLLRKH